MKWAAAAFFLCGILASSSIDALEIKIIENQMIVSGGIETNDGWTFARAVANNPQVDTIVLRDMPGGKVSAMRQMVNALEDRKLTTVVSRSCRSASAVVFLAGERRQFADDFRRPIPTSVSTRPFVRKAASRGMPRRRLPTNTSGS